VGWGPKWMMEERNSWGEKLKKATPLTTNQISPRASKWEDAKGTYPQKFPQEGVMRWIKIVEGLKGRERKKRDLARRSRRNLR